MEKCEDFLEKTSEQYDILYSSNIYHLLSADERTQFRMKVKELLNQNGYLLLSMLSINDPQQRKEKKSSNAINVHLFIKEEILQDFNFLQLHKLFEHEYIENQAQGENHHHISWILIGQNYKGKT